MDKPSGFTLIELLVVVAIMTVLSLALLPNLLRARYAADDGASKAYLREVSTAVEARRNFATGALPPASACYLLTSRAIEPMSVTECTYTPDASGGYNVTVKSRSGKVFVFDGGYLREP